MTIAEKTEKAIFLLRSFEPSEGYSHDGCKTWVSIEPYPTPNMIEQEMTEILEAVSFADRIIFGRANYSKEASAYRQHKQFYNACAEEVKRFCLARLIGCHIKDKTITE